MLRVIVFALITAVLGICVWAMFVTHQWLFGSLMFIGVCFAVALADHR